jgi:hypothetical protein
MTSPENAPFSHSEARRDWRAWARGSESLASVFSNTKAASRFNALKHGLDAASILLPGEDPDAYDRMVADYAAPINTPKTPASTCSWPCTLPTNSTTTRRIGFGRRPTLTQRPYPKCALHPMPWPPAPDPWPLIP